MTIKSTCERNQELLCCKNCVVKYLSISDLVKFFYEPYKQEEGLEWVSF